MFMVLLDISLFTCVWVRLTVVSFIVTFSRYPDSRLMKGSYTEEEIKLIAIVHTIITQHTLLSAMAVCFIISSTITSLPSSSASPRVVCPFCRGASEL